MQMRGTTHPCVYGTSCISVTALQGFVVLVWSGDFFRFLPFPIGIMGLRCYCFYIVWELTQCKSVFFFLLFFSFTAFPYSVTLFVLAQFSAIVCGDRLSINLNAFFHFERCETAIKTHKKQNNKIPAQKQEQVQQQQQHGNAVFATAHACTCVFNYKQQQ